MGALQSLVALAALSSPAARSYNQRASGLLGKGVPGGETDSRHGIADRSARLGELRLLPEAEVHDSLILAEAALRQCSFLLTSGAHLHSLDFDPLTFEIQFFDVTAPVVSSVPLFQFHFAFSAASISAHDSARRYWGIVHHLSTAW